MIRLLARSLEVAGVGASRIDIGHVGLFHAIARLAGITGEAERDLFSVLQNKAVPELGEIAAGVDEPARSALLALPMLYGGKEVLARGRAVLPADPAILAALDELDAIAAALPDLPLSFDLADLRGYDYHSGLVFAAFCGTSPAAVAYGGRYDEVGRAFGRARPATGFSINDLRDLLSPDHEGPGMKAILAPLGEDPDLLGVIAVLRSAGEVVIQELPGHAGTWEEAGCDRKLILQDGRWVTVQLQGD